MLDRFAYAYTVALFVAGAAWAAEGTSALDALVGEPTPLKQDERIVFVGDSITMQGGFVEIIAKAIKEKQPKLGVKVTRYGLNGGRVLDVAKGKTPWGEAKPWAKILAEDKPTILVLYLGVNDVMHSPGTSKEDFEKGLASLVTEAREAGAAVVLATPAVNGERIDPASAAQKKLDEYAAIGRSVAKANKASLCDLRQAFVDYLANNNPQKKNSGILTYDGVHMSDKGNQLIAEWMSQAIAATAKGRTAR